MRQAEQNPSESGRRLDIIVADDMRFYRYLMLAFLSSAGHRIRTATDGQTAFKMVVLFAPDLLITDLEMPGGGGFDLIYAIRSSPDERLRRTSIIVCSSRSGIYTLNSALDFGANSFITKPLNRNELYLAINNLQSIGTQDGE